MTVRDLVKTFFVAEGLPPAALDYMIAEAPHPSLTERWDDDSEKYSESMLALIVESALREGRRWPGHAGDPDEVL